MEITLGLAVFVIGIIGMIICFNLLITSPLRYRKQRKKLLDTLQKL